MSDDDPRFFFVHVMKTGGATFRRHIDANFPEPGAVYPARDLDDNMSEANMLVPRLLQLPAERHAAIRVYTGHFPYVTARLLDSDLVTLSLVREPVARTISLLKHCKRYLPQHREDTLEQIYDDGFVFPTLIRDHQTKIFAMTAQDRPESYLDVIEIDDERLRIAESNLKQVDVMGLHEHYDDFLSEVSRRFGWKLRERDSWHVSEERWQVDDSLRQRIASDNRHDVAFYEFARELVASRAR